MARKGTVEWELGRMTQRDESGVEYFRHYSLRTDGKLLTKLRTVEPDGKTRHDYGWKLCPKATQEHIKKYGGEKVRQQLIAKGYS